MAKRDEPLDAYEAMMRNRPSAGDFYLVSGDGIEPSQTESYREIMKKVGYGSSGSFFDDVPFGELPDEGALGLEVELDDVEGERVEDID